MIDGNARKQEKILNDAVALCNERVSLLMETFRNEMGENQEEVKVLIGDISNRMTESDISTRDGIMKLLSSRLEHIEATILSEATQRSEEDKAITTHISKIIISMRKEIG